MYITEPLFWNVLRSCLIPLLIWGVTRCDCVHWWLQLLLTVNELSFAGNMSSLMFSAHLTHPSGFWTDFFLLNGSYLEGGGIRIRALPNWRHRIRRRWFQIHWQRTMSISLHHNSRLGNSATQHHHKRLQGVQIFNLEPRPWEMHVLWRISEIWPDTNIYQICQFATSMKLFVPFKSFPAIVSILQTHFLRIPLNYDIVVHNGSWFISMITTCTHFTREALMS